MRNGVAAQKLQGGGKAISALLLTAALTFLISGCNSTIGPVNLDGSGTDLRFGQNINAPDTWDVGYSLDSATTVFVHPWLSAGSTVCGDIAETDTIGIGDPFSPLVTAVVKHDNTLAPSEIRLILLDEENDNVYEDTFSADALNPDDPYARLGKFKN